MLPVAMSLDRLLTAAALTPTAAVVVYGAIVTVTNPEGRIEQEHVAVLQASANDSFVLQYADEQKALFKTDHGYRLTMIGSSLDDAGHVASIEMVDGRWTVTTDRGAVFVLQPH